MDQVQYEIVRDNSHSSQCVQHDDEFPTPLRVKRLVFAESHPDEKKRKKKGRRRRKNEKKGGVGKILRQKEKTKKKKEKKKK